MQVMYYSVRNRRRLRPTGELGVTRTPTLRGVGVDDVPSAPPRAEGSGLLRPLPAPVKEVVPASVIRLNWQR